MAASCASPRLPASSPPVHNPIPLMFSSDASAGCPSSLSCAIMPIAATFSLRFSVSSRSLDALRSTIIWGRGAGFGAGQSSRHESAREIFLVPAFVLFRVGRVTGGSASVPSP